SHTPHDLPSFPTRRSSDLLPDVTTLLDVRLQTPMQVFTADGELISQFGEKRRIPLKLEEMPPLLVQAFLAVEDTRFYEHPGIDRSEEHTSELQSRENLVCR